MKLNYDCVRDMLLALEKLLTINDDLCHEYVPVDKLFEVLNKYDQKEVLHSFLEIGRAGYINYDYQFWGGGQFYEGSVHDLTYCGHEFLESIRDNQIWENVKSVLSDINNISLQLIFGVAKGLAMNALQNAINNQ